MKVSPAVIYKGDNVQLSDNFYCSEEQFKNAGWFNKNGWIVVWPAKLADGTELWFEVPDLQVEVEE